MSEGKKLKYIYIYIAIIFIVVLFLYLDSLSTNKLDISGQSEALRVSPSQDMTSPSLFQQGLPGGF